MDTNNNKIKDYLDEQTEKISDDDSWIKII